MIDLVVINFTEFIKESQNFRSVAKSLYLFLTTPDEAQSSSSDNCTQQYNVRFLNLFEPELKLMNIKPVIKKKFKALLNELNKFKVHTVSVLDYKK